MTGSASEPPMLRTTAGDFPLAECRLSVGGRTWAVRHVAAVLTRGEEDRYVSDPANPLPYGAALWPSAIALAHEVATRAAEFRGKTVLELGAGTGLPGVVAASLGAAVVQTDCHELALHVCRLNGERNGARGIEYRPADWTAWDDPRRYNWIVGADILYADERHPHLRHIFERNLAPAGRLLIADPFRRPSLTLLERLVADGWGATHARWTIGDAAESRPVGVYELTPPGGHAVP
jgi:predicted nicotinamide N-methyase